MPTGPHSKRRAAACSKSWGGRRFQVYPNVDDTCGLYARYDPMSQGFRAELCIKDGYDGRKRWVTVLLLPAEQEMVVDLMEESCQKVMGRSLRDAWADDLRHMEGQEGLVLQGCGGPPQEWVDGINGLLTEAGILLDGSLFKLEDVSLFQHGESTCLLFPFEGVKLDMGRLAMWRIQTHGQFGGTWLSDYVPNWLGGFVQKQQAPRKPKMDLAGHDGNIFSIMGRASFLLQMAGMNAENKEMVDRVTSCGDYNKALNIISEYVETELSPKPEPQKTTKKKKGRNAHER